jgi:hypothetical protein
MSNKKKLAALLIVGVLAIAGWSAFPKRDTAPFQSGSQVQGGVPQGTTDQQYPVVVGGNDGTIIRTLRTDSSGQLQVGMASGASVAVSNFPTTYPGTVTVSNFPSTYPGTVTVSNFPATQPVSISGTVPVSGTVTTSTPTANPCGNPGVIPNSAPISITTSTTTQLVPGVAGQQVFVCGLTIAMSGTVLADTFLLEYGTGSTCTSPTALTGAMTSGILTAGATVIPAAPLALKPSAVGASLCAVSTVGTLPSIAGVLSFVQQ